jgi:hypothetical protein
LRVFAMIAENHAVEKPDAKSELLGNVSNNEESTAPTAMQNQPDIFSLI